MRVGSEVLEVKFAAPKYQNMSKKYAKLYELQVKSLPQPVQVIERKVSADAVKSGFTNVYIANIPRGYFIIDDFKQIGPITSANSYDGVTFVDFENHEDALMAIAQFHGLKLPNARLPLKVRFATTKNQRKNHKHNKIKEQEEEQGTQYFDTTILLQDQIMQIIECIDTYEQRMQYY
jgi:hypothetical protein